MRTENIITRLLAATKKKLGDLPRHPQAHLYPYEVVAIGMLYGLKGGSFRAFYRWLSGDWEHLFSGPLPERTRLLRLLTRHQEEAARFLVQSRGELICDSYGMEMVHPWRAERSRRGNAYWKRQRKRSNTPKTLARKGLSNRRWIVGAKLGVLIRPDGKVVDFAWDTANVHDSTFNFLAERHSNSRVLGDLGYAQVAGQPSNLVLCHKGELTQRMIVETVFGVMTMVSHTKRL